MKRILPSRRFLKWAGLVLSILFGAAWASSLFWCVYAIDARNGYRLAYCGFRAGCCVFHFADGSVYQIAWDLQPGVHWYATPRQFRLTWLPRGEINQEPWLSLPIWMPLALAAAPTAYLWWRDRRVAPGHCPKCRYDLTGLAPDAACPECGREQS